MAITVGSLSIPTTGTAPKVAAKGAAEAAIETLVQYVADQASDELDRLAGSISNIAVASGFGPYATPAAGIAATTNGQVFTAYDGARFVGYQNASGVAVPLSSFASLSDTDYDNRHPLSKTVSMSYDPGTMTVHTGGLLYSLADARVWRVNSEAFSHGPELGMSVYAEYSDDFGASWRGKRAIVPGEPNRRVLAMSCTYLDGRILVVVNTQDAGANRYLQAVYSDNEGSSWSTASIANPAGVNPFMYGALHLRPAAAGGSDTGGAVFYCYTNRRTYAFYTNDAGDTWSNTLLMDGTNVSYINAAGGTSVNNLTPEEVAVAACAGDKYVFYFRCQNQDNFICGVSTDMLTVTGYRDTGINNEGPTLETGTPPHFIPWGDDVYLYTFGRENWMDHDVSLEQAVMFHRMNGVELFNAGGVFSDLMPKIACRLPNRAVGMMAHAYTPDGVIAQLRAGESVFAANENPATSQAYQMTGYQIQSNPILHRPNIADNANLDLWGRGTSFTGITDDATPVAERFQAYCSEISGGDTMSFTRVTIDSILSNSLPHKPRYGMRIQSTGAQYSGFQQAFIGEAAMSWLSDSEITVTVIGIGVMPTTMRLQVVFDYGPDFVAGAATFTKGRDSVTGVTTISGSLVTPSMEGAVLTNPAAFVRIDQTSSDPWDFTLVGFKMEFGNGATVMLPVNPSDERAKATGYFQQLPDTIMCHRLSSTQSAAYIQHTPMVRRPALGGYNLSTGFTIQHLTGTREVTGITKDRQSDGGFRMLLAHESDTSFTVGGTYQSLADSVIYIDAEQIA